MLKGISDGNFNHVSPPLDLDAYHCLTCNTKNMEDQKRGSILL